MMLHRLDRLKRMDAAEITWRTRAAMRAAMDRMRLRISPAAWTRASLVRTLAGSDDLAAVRSALRENRWDLAHRELSRHFVEATQRFVVAPAAKNALVRRITTEFPSAVEHARRRGDRLVEGQYDLLGYRGLRFDAATPSTRDRADRPEPRAALDWHLDPVAGRRAPRLFWADVPYLDPSCGDHKVIWELNRHQHWIALGRAYWLTGDAKYRNRVIAELAGWLDANPPLSGVNWASMLELSLRSISWVWAINLFADPASPNESPWLVDMLAALDLQLAHVERNLSYYFSPNTHLLGEALALYVCGRALPQLAASGRRQALGRAILIDEIDRQIAADGGHAERSTHYQRYTLDFYSLALAVARLTHDDEASDRFDDAVSRLAFAVRLLANDHGVMPHLGDDDGGALLPLTGRPADDVRDSLAVAAALTGCIDLQIGSAPEEALWLTGSLPGVHPKSPAADAGPMRSSALPDTGYYISRSGGGHLVIDGGPHGYQNAGHAHADALALTWSVRGLPLLIDPGTACYTVDTALRDRMRSTALHNTITIDGRSQSVPRGPFHWDRVANASVFAWRANDAFDFFDGSHDGYSPVRHRRRVFSLHGDLVVVADLVDGTGVHSASAHWHLDPRWNVDALGSRAVLTCAGEHVGLTVPSHAIERIAGDDPGTGLGWYSPVYGALARTTTLRIHHEGPAPFWLISVFDLNPENRVLAIETIPVWAEAGTLAHGVGLRMARTASTDLVLFAEREPPATAASGEQTSAARPTWRLGDVETDARMLFCRAGSDRPIARLAIVDGSIVRVPGRRSFVLALPRIASDLHLDFTADARIAGAAFGARLVVGGEEMPIELDRRAAPRTAN